MGVIESEILIQKKEIKKVEEETFIEFEKLITEIEELNVKNSKFSDAF